MGFVSKPDTGVYFDQITFFEFAIWCQHRGSALWAASVELVAPLASTFLSLPLKYGERSFWFFFHFGKVGIPESGEIIVLFHAHGQGLMCCHQQGCLDHEGSSVRHHQFSSYHEDGDDQEGPHGSADRIC